MHETAILSHLKSIWDRHYSSYQRPLSVQYKQALNEQLAEMFLSLDHSKPLHIETQSMFVAVWANVNMKYALNFLMMDGYCTQINMFSITVLLKVMSISSGAYHYRLIKQIWNVILQNKTILDAMFNHGPTNIVSYSMLTLAVQDRELNTMVALLQATAGNRQIFMQKTLTAVLRRICNARCQQEYRWTVQYIWNKSSNIFSSFYDERYRKNFLFLMQQACELHGLLDLQQEVREKDKGLSLPKTFRNHVS